MKMFFKKGLDMHACIFICLLFILKIMKLISWSILYFSRSKVKQML